MSQVAPKRDGLRRRTSSIKVADLRLLPVNDFWRQTQQVLSLHLLRADCTPEQYVPVFVGPKKSLLEELGEFVELPAEPDLLLLVGQYGVGKSTTLQQFALERTRSSAAKPGLAWISFDANPVAAELSETPERLLRHLKNATATVLDKSLAERELDYEAFLRDSYCHDSLFAADRLDKPQPDAEAIGRVREEFKTSVHSFLACALRHLVRDHGKRRVVLVLDNLDPLSHAAQLRAVKDAAMLSRACEVKVIIAMRRATHARLNFRDPDTIQPFVTTEVPSPQMTEVIRKRIEAALSESQAQNAVLGEGALRARLRDSPEFASTLIRALSAPAVERFIDGYSNGSVREALHMAVRVYNSHFLDATRIIRKLSPADPLAPSAWHGVLPYYVVVKALVLVNYPIYRPDVSGVGNMFGTHRSATHVDPFLRLLILLFLKGHLPDEVDETDLTRELVDALEVESDLVRSEVDWLVRHSWLDHTEPAHLSLSRRGSFVLNEFVNDVEYLTHIATDVDMEPALEGRLYAPAENIGRRLENLEVLLEYLVAAEGRLLKRLTRRGLNPFVRLVGREGLMPPTLQAVLVAVRRIHYEDGGSGGEAKIAEARNACLKRLNNLLEQSKREVRELLEIYAV